LVRFRHNLLAIDLAGKSLSTLQNLGEPRSVESALDLKLNISNTYPLENFRFDQEFEKRQDVVEIPNTVEEDYSFRP
jgi:hypothetical protein